MALKQNGPIYIALYDLEGCLRVEALTSLRSGNDASIPISETLENGTYVFRVQTKEGQATGKVMVQR